MQQGRLNHNGFSLERTAATLSALVFVGLVVFLLVRNERFADANLVVILRIMLSASVAILGATIPGFLNIQWSAKGMALRAGGALALFVLTYLVTPGFVGQDPAGGAGAATVIHQSSTGASSPPIVNNTGVVNIDGKAR